MCGIIGYLGKQEARPILLDGLKRLEYRGYDSAGIYIGNKDKGKFFKAVGKIKDLNEKIEGKKIEGNYGIGHTRWATHGKPTVSNTHPHFGCNKDIWIAHNGIIENYKKLKNELIKSGHKFTSETDSEVIAHLIEEFTKDLNLEESVRKAVGKLKGTYGLIVVSKKEPDKIVIAKNSSPLLIGVGNDEYLVASDASAIVSYTKKVIYLNDKEMGVITPEGFRCFDLNNQKISKEVDHIDWDIEKAQKEGFKHFMLKEIYQQPEAIENSIRGRLIEKEGTAKLGGLEIVEDKLQKKNHLIISSCGTAYLSGLTAKYMLEEYAGISTEVDFASEFRYRKSVIKPQTVFLAISQSGETADTLASLEEMKRKNVLSLGIVNTVGSTIARNTDAGVYNHIGPEIAVASTKAFTSQLTILTLLTLFLGRQRNMSFVMGKRIIKELKKLPSFVSKILEKKEEIKKIAKKYSKYDNFIFLGRKYNYPIALEGALKLKEISYVHAEGYSAGEMKHGPIAMIDKNMPSVCIAPSDSVYEKMISNIEEIKARGGKVIAIATKGNKEIGKISDECIYIPKTLEMLTPILTIIPLQLFAYYISIYRKNNPDKPRNLAKSVTVE